jgi:hypothetical protein
MIKRALVTVCCLSLAVAVPAVAGSKTTFFKTANGKISCQLSSGGALGTLAYCQTTGPASSAKLHRNGFVKICKGVGCIGNPPENATTITAEHDVVVGPFTCYTTIARTVVCYVTKTGKGLEVSGSGIKKFTVRKVATL